MADGAVASVFSYATTSGGATNEIDIELLSKQTNHPGAGGPTVALTNWKNWQATDGHGNGAHHSSVSPAVAGLDLASFNEFTIRWLPGMTQWLVNGQIVAELAEAVPNQGRPWRPRP